MKKGKDMNKIYEIRKMYLEKLIEYRVCVHACLQ